jgi:hypothetical protein
MASSETLRPVALVRTTFRKNLAPPSSGFTRIGELGTALAVTSNRRTQRRVFAYIYIYAAIIYIIAINRSGLGRRSNEFIFLVLLLFLLLWPSGQSSWLQTQVPGSIPCATRFLQ